MFRPCFKSGLCCRKAPCPFGEWDSVKKQCVFLGIEEILTNPDATIYKCEKYDEIRSLPKEYGAEIAPAFGSGCCMPIGNTFRMAIIEHFKR